MLEGNLCRRTLKASVDLALTVDAWERPEFFRCAHREHYRWW